MSLGKGRYIKLLVVSLGMLALWPLLIQSPLAQEPRPAGEWEIKAAFLFNFAKFIEWPDDKLPPGSPLIIGILGEDPFKNDLEKVVAGKNVGGHQIETRRFNSVDEAQKAHILFISPSERRRVNLILQEVSGRNILTVSDLPDFTKDGGVVNFRRAEGKVRFEISPLAAEAQGLKLSSKLLSVAIVTD